MPTTTTLKDLLDNQIILLRLIGDLEIDVDTCRDCLKQLGVTGPVYAKLRAAREQMNGRAVARRRVIKIADRPRRR